MSLKENDIYFEQHREWEREPSPIAFTLTEEQRRDALDACARIQVAVEKIQDSLVGMLLIIERQRKENREWTNHIIHDEPHPDCHLCKLPH